MKSPKIISKIPQNQQIIFMQSDINYTIIHLQDGRKLISGYNLKFFENIVCNNAFKRLSRSIIVNKQFVKSISKDDLQLTMFDGKKVNVTRRRMKDLIDWI
jgi:two-component system LytT family response regulator